ncbi:transient receptor potential cation channel subfamily V member 5 [Anopheles ziemanni]|uniref:transient receptor potential cation channel subfamily V member 5 n=1 Tax=Anopheles coustani TaxID=139045 RepID=UPI00265B14C7|nr:transient receptor potential cation channel subfamily V member 5 [Anopheles coustani]XP_058172280.1 transient receptor potential cation channel subfamily V member 5 [Anopheles ziemanni]
MGNTESNVTSGVKKQAGVSTQALYKFVNLKGGGLLVDMMKRAIQNKQYAEIDHAIKTKVEPFLYNKGKGKYVPVSVLVLLRNRERPRHKQLPEIRAMENPEEDFDMDAVCPEVTEAEYYLNPSGYREVCWNVNERGAVGETILHLCLLNATSLHADLAKRLLRFYPKLINDVYMCDEYYGESVLHLAIVNEDPAMVKYLLDHDADVNERCCGTFMCPEDQKASRYDTPETEVVQMVQLTNYDGYVYWGEYPLTFAACLGQEECYRLVLARGADPDNKDFNGNTVLHMLVIYEKITTFDMGYEVGSSLSIRNHQNLTPLTLAAKLGRVEMFFHIMNIEREIYWQLGSITCAAYPLVLIDTIDVETGNISKDSALNLVVFGDKDEHLDLLDGVLIDLLKTKWNTFVKDKFYRQFFMFFCYFCVSLISFTLRNGPPPADDGSEEGGNKTANSKEDLRQPDSWNRTSLEDILESLGFNSSGMSVGLDMEETLVAIIGGRLTELQQLHNSSGTDPETSDTLDEGLFFTANCHTMDYDGVEGKVRLISEMIILVGAFLYLLAALRELKFLGRKMFFENLMTAPSRVMFLFSCCIMMVVPFLKVLCFTELEDHVVVAIMLTTAPYFLFFCRGFKTVGPFVVMIYRMVMGDLLRFVVIYLVFVMGFSQAYYIVFLSYKPEEDGDANPMPSPIESIVAMFLMSLTNFGDYYGALENTDHEFCAKILFVLFMVIVAVLLVNMLIAMMGNTYQKIAETKNEWQRQWARIVLVVERGVPPKERLKNLMSYSQPMSDGRRALVLRLNMTDEDKEEMKEILEMKRVHERLSKKRQVEREARAEQRRLLREKYLNMAS